MQKTIETKLWIGDKSTNTFTLYKILRYVAILLLPVLLVTTFYFYQKADQVAGQDMIVKAGEGERVSITLPDGQM